MQPAPPTRAEPTCCPDYYRLLLPETASLKASPFKIDLKQLKREYLKLQAAVHPDRLAGDIGQSWSSWINRAHETLKDPLQRAIYLVNIYEKLAGRQPENEAETTEEEDGQHDISLVLEIREEMDSTTDPAALLRIKSENDQRISESCGELEGIFGEGRVDLGAARRCINRLRYWMSVDRELKEKL